jgi:thiol-disulfide isomerase/thioredoxin
LTKNRLSGFRFRDLLAGLLIGLGIGLAWFFGFGPGKDSLTKWFGKNEFSVLLAPEKNQPVSEFSLKDLSGTEIRLGDLKGKPILINFWASWCIPCREEMPLIEKYFQKYPQELQVVAVNDGESEEVVRTFAEGLDLSFPILLDPQSDTSRRYNVLGLPTTFFIDKNGILKYQHTGILTEAQLLNYLKELGIPSS